MIDSWNGWIYKYMFQQTRNVQLGLFLSTLNADRVHWRKLSMKTSQKISVKHYLIGEIKSHSYQMFFFNKQQHPLSENALL